MDWVATYVSVLKRIVAGYSTGSGSIAVRNSMCNTGAKSILPLIRTGD